MRDRNDYIRRVRQKEHIRDEKVYPRAFKFDADDENEGLSTTRCGQRVRSSEQIEKYRSAACSHVAGTLGICFVNKVQAEEIGLELTHQRVKGAPFGHKHYLMRDPSEPNLCPGEDKRRLLARYATENGGCRPFEPLPASAAECD